jgi:molybdopterin converting factor small subunit
VIRVKVELLPGLKPIRGERKFETEVREGATVKDLFLAVGYEEGEIEHLRVWIGKSSASLNTVLKDRDEVTAGVPLAGG